VTETILLFRKEAGPAATSPDQLSLDLARRFASTKPRPPQNGVPGNFPDFPFRGLSLGLRLNHGIRKLSIIRQIRTHKRPSIGEPPRQKSWGRSSPYRSKKPLRAIEDAKRHKGANKLPLKSLKIGDGKPWSELVTNLQFRGSQADLNVAQSGPIVGVGNLGLAARSVARIAVRGQGNCHGIFRRLRSHREHSSSSKLEGAVNGGLAALRTIVHSRRVHMWVPLLMPT
jgi:hypothetical protein